MDNVALEVTNTILAPSGVFVFDDIDAGFVSAVLFIIIVPDCPILAVGATKVSA